MPKVKKHVVFAGAPQRQDYRTPEPLRARVIHFAREQGIKVLDPCAGVHRADHWCDHNYTEAGDGLNADWTVAPFMFANIQYADALLWAARQEQMRSRVGLGVFLIPNYSDTTWFARMMDAGHTLVTFKGRLVFELPYRDRRALAGKKIGRSPARFASAMIAFGASGALRDAWRKRWQHDERARVLVTL